MQFTDVLIESLKPQSRRYDLSEINSKDFIIRVLPLDQKFWKFIYHYVGKKKWMALYSYPEMFLAETRKLYNQASGRLTNNQSPAIVRYHISLEIHCVFIMIELICEFIEQWLKSLK